MKNVRSNGNLNQTMETVEGSKLRCRYRFDMDRSSYSGAKASI